MNFQLIKEHFPSCITESTDQDGNIVEAIDFDKLKEELSDHIADDQSERYQLTWPGKREANLKLRHKSQLTLRPKPTESVNFQTTKNLFIEGDNFEVLKLLQEAYLNKIKLIYIDPPYNTGKDFIYKDRFAQDTDEFLEESGQMDQDGNYLVENRETNGRYHSDWLSMMYPRLKIARNLLKEDGVIFISIDDHEVHNLRKICDEIFGAGNFVAELPTIMNLKGNNDQFAFSGTHEYTIVYAKNISKLSIGYFPLYEEETEEWKQDDKGYFKQGASLKATGEAATKEDRPNLYFPLYISNELKVSLEFKDGWYELFPITNTQEMRWRWSKTKFLNNLDEIIVARTKDGFSIYKKQRPNLGDLPSAKPKSLFYKPSYSSGNGTSMIKELFGDKLFNNPKPLDLIKDFVVIATKPNPKTPDIILDFFAGSGTTAHAVMQQNAEDGGNRRFMLVQLDEKCNENSAAAKAGYENIAQISRERIKRAGTQIQEKLQNELKTLKEKHNSSLKLDQQTEKEIANLEEKLQNLDFGFRTLKLDEPNTIQTRFTPKETEQTQIFNHVDHIKPDRTDEDLLFHVLLELKIPLTAKIEERQMQGKRVFFVNETELVAYFGRNGEINKEFVRELVNIKPEKIAFCDSGFDSDQTKINAIEMIKQLAKGTKIYVL